MQPVSASSAYQSLPPDTTHAISSNNKTGNITGHIKMIYGTGDDIKKFKENEKIVLALADLNEISGYLVGEVFKSPGKFISDISSNKIEVDEKAL